MSGSRTHRASIEAFVRNPRKLFLIDGIGALITASFLLAVLRPFEDCFGMPVVALNYLAGIAIAFCFYSAACYHFLKRNHRPYLRVIALGNFLYCALTAALLLIHRELLSVLGWAYFTAEIALVLGLSAVELSVLKRLGSKNERPN